MNEKKKLTPIFMLAMEKAISETKDPNQASYGRQLMNSAYEYHKEKKTEVPAAISLEASSLEG